jgi:hypothetical protein
MPASGVVPKSNFGSIGPLVWEEMENEQTGHKPKFGHLLFFVTIPMQKK